MTGWQPIETAPKDGTVVWLNGPTIGLALGYFGLKGSDYWSCSHDSCAQNTGDTWREPCGRPHSWPPIFWQPFEKPSERLPRPPEQSQ